MKLVLRQGACHVPSLALFFHPRWAATDLKTESLELAAFSVPKSWDQITAAAFANSWSWVSVQFCVVKRKISSLRFTSVMFPLLFVNARTPAKFCSTPELEKPQPIALLRACLSSSWGWCWRFRLSSHNYIQSCFPGHHWFHVCRVVVCKLGLATRTHQRTKRLTLCGSYR